MLSRNHTSDIRYPLSCYHGYHFSFPLTAYSFKTWPTCSLCYIAHYHWPWTSGKRHYSLRCLFFHWGNRTHKNLARFLTDANFCIKLNSLRGRFGILRAQIWKLVEQKIRYNRLIFCFFSFVGKGRGGTTFMVARFRVNILADTFNFDIWICQSQ